MINRALDTSNPEADIARFKAEVADKEFARLKDELESSRRREGESFEKEVNPAYRRGKREVVEVMQKRRDKFSQNFGELKERYKALRIIVSVVEPWVVCILRSFLTTRMLASMRGRQCVWPRKIKTLQYLRQRKKIWEQLDPFPVSPDTVEAETGGLGETGEANHPVALLVGRSMSGNFDLGD